MCLLDCSFFVTFNEDKIIKGILQITEKNVHNTQAPNILTDSTFFITVEDLNMHSEKKMILEWKTNYQLEARNEKGLSVKFDAPTTHGGEETALSPMENVLASLAACSSFHVLTILKKKRQKISSYTVEATAERREAPPPRVFTKIHLKYIVNGQNIDPEAVKKAIKLSEEKYCSVGGMLKKAVEISSSYETLEES
jgi:putative redox protein